MSGLFSQIRTLTLGAAHDLVNKAIDMNSPSALRQGCRDIEAALQELQDKAAEQTGAVRTLTRQKTTLETQIQEQLTLAKKLNENPANEALVKSKAIQIAKFQSDLKGVNESLVDQTKVADQMNASAEGLKARLQTLVARTHELERIDASTKAKTQAAHALDSASHVLSAGPDSAGIDDLEAKMRAKADVADVKFERAMGTLTSATVAEEPAGVDDVMALINAK